MGNNLKRSQLARKQAKAAKKAGLEIAEAYSEYVEEYYKVSRKLRAAGVKVGKSHKQGLFVAGQYFEDWARAEVLNIVDFQRKFAKSSGNIEAFVEKEYNLLSTDLAEEVQLRLEAAGLGRFDLDKIKARRLPQKIWNKMEKLALTEGKSISEYFFGSN